MTTALAHYGEELGTAGISESKMHELCAEAGFSHVCKFARYMGGFSLIPWEVQSLSRCTIAREIPRNVHILSHATSKFTIFRWFHRFHFLNEPSQLYALLFSELLRFLRTHDLHLYLLSQ